MVSGTGLLCFEDATLQSDPDSGGCLQIKSAASNNCYSKLPYRLAWEPSAESVTRLRKFMATTYAGCAHGEYLDSCMEALAVYGVGGHHRILVHVDNGGAGKSARNALRTSVFGSGVRSLPASALQTPEEFRKQGAALAGCIMIQVGEYRAYPLLGILSTF